MLETLMFVFFVEVGWIPEQGVIMPERREVIGNIMYLDMDAYIQYSVLWVQFGMKTYSWFYEWESLIPVYWPARTDFRMAIGFTFGILTVGLRHLCSHSIDPYGRITDPVDGFYDEIFLKLKGKVGGKK